jgi:folate-binding protein YgfZ
MLSTPNPLHDLHAQAEAEFQPYVDVEIVSTFGEPQAEYAAIRKGAALFDLPHRGLLEITGKDRLDFLNRFITNQTWNKETKLPMPANTGVYAFLLNNKGRIITDMNVIELGDRTLLELDARNIPLLQTSLEKFVFSEKVAFASKVGQLHQIALHGPKASDILHQAGATNLPGLSILASSPVKIFDSDAIVWRDDPCGVPGLHLILAIESAKKIWMNLLSLFSSPDPTVIQNAKRQLWPIGWAAFNATRIEAGRPLFGIDFDDTILPAETGQLSRGVSFTKGCYLGQEIVARMHARGQVAKQIVGIRMEDNALPIAGTVIFDAEQNQIGGVTSSTLSPIMSNAAICLGLLKKPFFTGGTKIIIPAEGAMRQAEVVELPFVR